MAPKLAQNIRDAGNVWRLMCVQRKLIVSNAILVHDGCACHDYTTSPTNKYETILIASSTASNQQLVQDQHSRDTAARRVLFIIWMN
jgi:hypothetical protein